MMSTCKCEEMTPEKYIREKLEAHNRFMEELAQDLREANEKRDVLIEIMDAIIKQQSCQSRCS